MLSHSLTHITLLMEKMSQNLQVEPQERRRFLKTLPLIVLSHFKTQYSFLNQRSCSADRESEEKQYYSTSLCQYQQSINRRNPAKSCRTAKPHTHIKQSSPTPQTAGLHAPSEKLLPASVCMWIQSFSPLLN